MDNRVNEMLEFLSNAHSNYHATAALVWELEAAGYICLAESQNWELTAGGKYYLTRGGSTVVAFRVPEQTPTGFMISGSHTDRPGFKLRENGELVDRYTRQTVSRYGSPMMSSWLDRPLSIAGRVLVETEDGLEARIVDIDRDLIMIPNVAMHMNFKANEGVPYNVAVDMVPLLGDKNDGGKLMALVEEQAGGKILSHDLYLYNRQKATLWGMEQQYFSAPGLDDSECAWCCTQGFLQAPEAASIPVLCVFDNEEIGSGTIQGADSCLMEDVLERISQALGLDMNRMLAQSFMVSADNAHAIHPNHPEHSESKTGVMNSGIAIKCNPKEYASDGMSTSIFRKICQKAGVPTQIFYNRADKKGGTTLGGLSITHVSVPTVDIGLLQLAMHSSYETGGVQDALWLMDAMAAYYGTSLECPADGTYIIK